jgi:hypothetical protein
MLARSDGDKQGRIVWSLFNRPNGSESEITLHMFRFHESSSRVGSVLFGYRVGLSTFTIASLLLLALSKDSFSAPIQTSWSGGTGVWSNPANWSNGVPIAGYQAVINAGNATLDVISPALDSVGICTGASCAGASLIVNSTLSAGSMQSFGSLTVNAGATLNTGTSPTLTGFVQEAPAVLIVNKNGQFLDLGWYSQGGGSTTVNGLLTTPLVNVTGGTITTGSGGIMNVGAGGYTQGGSVITTVNSGGQLNVTGAYGQGSGTTSIAGLLDTLLVSFTGGTVSVGNGGAIDVGSGGYSQGVEGGPNTATTIAHGGQISVTGGEYKQEIGTATIVDGSLFAADINNSGTFSGDGTISGDYMNLGSVNPGDNGLWTLTIMGDYAQTGFLDSVFDGLNPKSGDFLAVEGDATLKGTLNVTFGGGFTPQIGDIFPVMSFNSSSGTFNDVTSQNLPSGESLEALYGATGVSVTVVAAAASVPEPSSFAMAALVLISWFSVPAFFGAIRRRWNE